MSSSTLPYLFFTFAKYVGTFETTAAPIIWLVFAHSAPSRAFLPDTHFCAFVNFTQGPKNQQIIKETCVIHGGAERERINWPIRAARTKPVGVCAKMRTHDGLAKKSQFVLIIYVCGRDCRPVIVLAHAACLRHANKSVGWINYYARRGCSADAVSISERATHSLLSLTRARARIYIYICIHTPALHLGKRTLLGSRRGEAPNAGRHVMYTREHTHIIYCCVHRLVAQAPPSWPKQLVFPPNKINIAAWLCLGPIHPAAAPLHANSSASAAGEQQQHQSDWRHQLRRK